MSLLRNLAHSHLKNATFSIQTRNMAKKAAKGAATKPKKVLDVETDAEKLVNYCCGANYQIEGEEVKLKDKSEYPEWLFTMDVKRPKPMSWQMEDKNCKEYFKACAREAYHKKNRLQKQGLLGLRDKK